VDPLTRVRTTDDLATMGAGEESTVGFTKKKDFI
jgi:hypothetical protein